MDRPLLDNYFYLFTGRYMTAEEFFEYCEMYKNFQPPWDDCYKTITIKDYANIIIARGKTENTTKQLE